MVARKGDEVLLVRRGHAPNAGEWSVPGGAQELGETVFEAAAREILEETGIVVEPRGVIEVVDAVTRDEGGRIRFHYTLVEIVADWVSGVPAAADDALEARWFGVENAAAIVPRAATARVIRRGAAFRNS